MRCVHTLEDEGKCVTMNHLTVFISRISEERSLQPTAPTPPNH